MGLTKKEILGDETFTLWVAEAFLSNATEQEVVALWQCFLTGMTPQQLAFMARFNRPNEDN